MAEKERIHRAFAKSFMGAVAGASFNRLPKVVAVPLVASDATAGILAWPNPEAGPIIVEELVLDVTTPATGACSASFGTASTAASASNLLDTLDVHTAGGQFDTTSNKGAGGHSSGKVAQGGYVTGTKVSGASAGLVGSAYISYYLA